MTEPGNINQLIPKGRDWIPRELSDLKRQIRRLTGGTHNAGGGNVVTGTIPTDPDTGVSITSTAAGAGSSSAEFDGDIAIGQNAQATGSFSVAVGSASGTGARAFGGASIAIGKNCEASGDEAITMGHLSTAIGDDTIAIGPSSEAEGDFSTAVGWGAHAIGYGSVALGNDATASGDNEVALGSDASPVSIDGKLYGHCRQAVKLTADYALLRRDEVFFCDGTFAISVPLFSSVLIGYAFTVRNTGSGSITVQRGLFSTTANFEGASTYVVAAGTVARFMYDGADWWLM